jgi:hypothetical protein
MFYSRPRTLPLLAPGLKSAVTNEPSEWFNTMSMALVALLHGKSFHSVKMHPRSISGSPQV